MKIYRTQTVLGLALALFAGAALGCQGETTGGEEPEVAEQAEALEQGEQAEAAGEARPERHRGKHEKRARHHGPTKLLHAALNELDLSAEQRATVEGSLAELRQGFGEGFDKADFAAKQKALAEAVRAGSVDPAAFAPDTAAMQERMKEGQAKIAAALETLHTTLTPEQRSELVATLQSRMSEHDEKRGKKGKRSRDRAGHASKGSPAMFMLRGIDVSDEQQAEIEAALQAAGLDRAPDREAWAEKKEAMKAQKQAMLTAFASDSFDADAFMPAAPAMRGKMGHPAVALAVIVPLLDEAQRSELAERIERGPMKKHHDKGRRGRGGPDHRGAAGDDTEI